MNLNRIVNMILNVVTRRVVNLLVNRGFQLFARRGGSQPAPESQPTDQAALNPADRAPQRDLAKRARFAARTLRRLGR